MFLANASHALLLEGPRGAGKKYLAQELAATLLDVDTTKVPSHPHVLTVTPEKGIISIDTIRSIKRFLHLRVPSKRTIARVVIVKDADSMSTEAQNALLKILEEPPSDTIIILTSSAPDRLLSTIRSRVRHLAVQSIDEMQLTEYFIGQGKTTVEVTRAFHISNGRIGLMTALLDSSIDQPLASAIAQAKTILASKPFERLKMVDALSKQKPDVELLLQAFERISHAALFAASAKDQLNQVVRWKNTLQLVIDAQGQISQSASTKLLLTNLMLSL